MSSLRTTTQPLLNLAQGRPVLVAFEVCLRCNSTCGYCNIPLNVGRYSIAIGASGNVAPCLALSYADNLLESSLEEILARFDRDAIRRCSDRSSCYRLRSRVVGSVLRPPLSALVAWKAQAEVEAKGKTWL